MRAPGTPSGLLEVMQYPAMNYVDPCPSNKLHLQPEPLAYVFNACLLCMMLSFVRRIVRQFALAAKSYPKTQLSLVCGFFAYLACYAKSQL